MTGYARPLPVITALNRPFWDASRAGRLVAQRCTSCGTWRFPPAPCCPECGSEQVEWAGLRGRGTVWSMCEFHRAYFKGFELPYNVALVALDEGPRFYTNLVGIAYSLIRIGMPVEAVFNPVTDDVTLTTFRPVAADRFEPRTEKR